MFSAVCMRRRVPTRGIVLRGRRARHGGAACRSGVACTAASCGVDDREQGTAPERTLSKYLALAATGGRGVGREFQGAHPPRGQGHVEQDGQHDVRGDQEHVWSEGQHGCEAATHLISAGTMTGGTGSVLKGMRKDSKCSESPRSCAKDVVTLRPDSKVTFSDSLERAVGRSPAAPDLGRGPFRISQSKGREWTFE